MSASDIWAGIVGGGNRALEAYMTAADKKKEREQQLGLLKAKEGLTQKVDENGNPTNEWVVDPVFEAKQRKQKALDEQNKAAAEGKNLTVDENGNIKFDSYSPGFIQGQQEINKAKSEGDPYGLKAMAALEARRSAEQKNLDVATPYGKANTSEDAKEIKQATEAKKKFDRMLDEMIQIRERNKGGSITNFSDIKRGKQLSKKALLEMKNMAKLGVLSKSDEDIVDAIIPDPTGIEDTSFVSNKAQDTVLQRLKALKNDTSNDFQTTLETRLRPNEGLIQPPQGLVPKGLIKPEEKKASVPKMGDVVDGYTFKGGDPSKPENWEVSKKAGM